VPPKLSNPRDLLVQLLGELLYVERRLAGDVIRSLAGSVRDEALRGALEHHLEQTRGHVERAETAFRRLEVAPSANLSQAFEAAVAEHEELSSKVAEPALADVFHAQAALRVEHLELALYAVVLELAAAFGKADAVEPLRESQREEDDARGALESAIARLAGEACAR
jgi:ferritin-like metal-binding protein YciE